MNAEDIAGSNYYTAIDQQHNYSSLDEALAVYEENAADTAVEQGIPTENVTALFWRFVKGELK